MTLDDTVECQVCSRKCRRIDQYKACSTKCLGQLDRMLAKRYESAILSADLMRRCVNWTEHSGKTRGFKYQSPN